MRMYDMFVLLIIFGNLFSLVHGAFIKSRTWHEDFVTYRKGQLDKVLYPRFKVCRAPREKPEKIKQKSLQNTVKTTEVSWADLLSVYSSDSGSEIFNWDIWKKEIDPKKATRWSQVLSIMRFTTVFVAIFMIFVFLVPIVGRCGFKFYSLIWFAICHPELRRICRRMFIMKEKLSRKHVQLLLSKTGDRSQKRRPFRLPFVLREYNEEEVPAELMYSNEDDSDEVSSDGFENLLIRNNKHRTGGGGGQNKTLSRNMVHLMASTEQEMARTETTQANATAEPSTQPKRQSFLDKLMNKPDAPKAK